MVVFLNGTLNSGKSTIAKLLAKKLGNSAIVEMDIFHSFIEWMDIDRALPIIHSLGVITIKQFVKEGLSVIIPYPLSLESYKKFEKKLKALDADIIVFTLAPKLEVLLSDRSEKKRGIWDKERIKYHYEGGQYKHLYGNIIDSSDQTPEETLNVILKKLNKND